MFGYLNARYACCVYTKTAQCSVRFVRQQPLLVAMATVSVQSAEQLSAQHILGLCLIIHLLVLAAMLTSCSLRPIFNARFVSVCLSQTPSQLVLHADLIVAAFLLSADQVLIYLVLRAIAELVGIVIDKVQRAARPALEYSFANQNLGHFAAAAARINLGVMLIGGATASLVLIATKYLSQKTFLGLEQHSLAFFLLVMRHAMPCIFGAAPFFLIVSRRKADTKLLDTIFVCMFVSSAVLLVPESPSALARIHLVCVAAYAGGAAIIVGKGFGVWPGITAVLCRRIMLS